MVVVEDKPIDLPMRGAGAVEVATGLSLEGEKFHT